MKKTAPTQVFLLQCWQVWRGEKPVWQFRLEIPATSEHYTFSDLHELKAFLEARLQRILRDATQENP